VFLYNDAAISTLTVKHPGALGGLYRVVFQEAWDLVAADLEACFYRGETAVRDNMFIPILFNGVLEDHYWSYSLIPVYENGKIGGVYDAFRNMTETVVGAQKLRESEARLKLATEVAQLGVFTWETGEERGSWENDRVYANSVSLGVQTLKGQTEKLVEVCWNQLSFLKRRKIESHVRLEASVPMHKPVGDIAQARVKMGA
jgi:PAS domain-containing protein